MVIYPDQHAIPVMSSRKYMIAGIAVVLVVSLFVVFSDDDAVDPDMSGIVTDIRQSGGGCTFTLNTDGSAVRCYCTEVPLVLGHYGVKGSFSDDGTIFFVSLLIAYDRR